MPTLNQFSLREGRHDKIAAMKPWMSWTLFFFATALIAFFSGEQWNTRIIVFLILAVPIVIWAVRQIMKAQASSR